MIICYSVLFIRLLSMVLPKLFCAIKLRMTLIRQEVID